MMNQQVFIFMATLLLVATTLVNAVPIPESFKRDVVQKRAYDHEAWQRQALASQQAVADQMAADNEKWQKEALASQSSVAAAQASAFEAEAKAAGHPVEHKKQNEEKPTPTATTTEAPKKTHAPKKSHSAKKSHSRKKSHSAKKTHSPKKSKPTTTTEAPKPTTTKAPKPKPTTTKAPKPKPTTTTTTEAPKPTTTKAPKPKPTSGGGGGGSKGSFSGEGTWYNTGLGSCGIENTDSDYIAAMNYIDMANGANPNNNPNCNKKVKIHGPNGDVVVAVTDTCPTCAKGDIDLSPGAFTEIAGLGDGRVEISWDWL